MVYIDHIFNLTASGMRRFFGGDNPNEQERHYWQELWRYRNLFKCSKNAFAQSFIDRQRDELLNETLFRSLAHVRATLEDYNTERPHSRLGRMGLDPLRRNTAVRSAAPPPMAAFRHQRPTGHDRPPNTDQRWIKVRGEVTANPDSLG
jgi:transposase InsO family protein